MHDAFLHLPSLIEYINEYNIPVCWTFHDCWSFTGGCTHFDFSGCNKWKSNCKDCNEWRSYTLLNVGLSEKIFNFKQKIANSINTFVVITPSKWLSNLVGQSIFSEHERIVINNGINLNVFRHKKSNFRKLYSCENKKIVLGVAFDWGMRKGLDIFNELAEMLPNDYLIVLVGTNTKIDEQISKKILSIHKTFCQEDLVDIYSEANVFVNPTLEDNFPTVNIEALSCGTPVITFNTGGSPEIINDSCGVVVKEKTAKCLLSAILNVCEEEMFSENACRERAFIFEEHLAYEKYVNIYLSEFAKGK
jgi:glycosyltransferase involved in cell wall biosynthesis